MFRLPPNHLMTHRKTGWDYRRPAWYMVTLTLADRTQNWLGHLEKNPAPIDKSDQWRIELSALGKIVEECWYDLARQWPGVEVRLRIIMPEHFHGKIHVTTVQPKPLGNIIGSFKSKTTSLARQLPRDQVPPSLHSASLWTKGFQDSILWTENRRERARRYILDNPRRLAERQLHPELFKVLRKFEIILPLGDGEVCGFFTGIGNHRLLEYPSLYQIQCSRSLFRYQCDKYGNPLKEFPPEHITTQFQQLCQEAFHAVRKGDVVITPCISHGEKEIARQIMAIGGKMIVLKDQGVSPFFKPAGKLFDYCTEGKLLMIAPAT